MRFRPCATKIAVAIPVLGAIVTPTFALPIAKNRFRPERIPFPVEVIRERVDDPPSRYVEVPVEPKEGTAVPVPTLAPNHTSGGEIIDHAYIHNIRLHNGVASAVKHRYNASESAKAEKDEALYEIEDIAPIEKRGVLSTLTAEAEEFTQPAQSTPEEQQESQGESDDYAFEEEFNCHTQKQCEKHIIQYLDTLSGHGGEDWERGWKSTQDERLEDPEVNASHHKQVAKPARAVRPREPTPDYFDGYFEVPINPDNTTTAKGVNSANIHAYLQNRFKPASAIAGDAPKYEVPAHLLPEALIDAQADPEGYLERRTKHRLTVLDIKAEEPAPTTVPEAAAVAAEAPTHSIDPTHTTPMRHIHLARPIIQN